MGVPNNPQPVFAQAATQIVYDNVHVAQKQAGAQLRLVCGAFFERLPGRPLVPMNDDELLFEASLEIMGEEHCRHPGSAMNEEHYRLLLVDTPDKEILGIPVDIELEQIGNRALSKDRHGERLERVHSDQQQDQRACDLWPMPIPVPVPRLQSSRLSLDKVQL